ncbi:MAG TPA: hotdog fold thioesterase [bacterium]|nr:hotdog fold thioesterase [bacterium]
MAEIDARFREGMKNTMAEALGMELLEVGQGRVVLTMPVDARTHQPYGLLHGGASVALAETAASIGGWFLVMKEGKVVVGQEINANHLRSVRSGKVKAVGEVLHQGKTSQVWEIKVYDEAERMICISRCTLAVIEPR